MNESLRHEQQALLTRAADVEGQRQAAVAARNVDHQRRLEGEIRRPWARFAAISERAA
jgi:hypothetical protein